MKRGVIIVQGLQLVLACLAAWKLFDNKLSSQSLVYTWLGILVPSGLLVLPVAGLATSCSNVFARHRERAALAFAGTPIAVVVLWWLTLFVADAMQLDRTSSAHWFFVQTGDLPQNEIFGSAMAVVDVVLLHSLAALLGIVTIIHVWLDRRRRRSTNESAA